MKPWKKYVSNRKIWFEDNLATKDHLGFTSGSSVFCKKPSALAPARSSKALRGGRLHAWVHRQGLDLWHWGALCWPRREIWPPGSTWLQGLLVEPMMKPMRRRSSLKLMTYKNPFSDRKFLDNLTGVLYENHVPYSIEANCWNWSRPSPLSLRSIWDCLVALRWSLLFGGIHLDGRWCWIPHWHDQKRLLVGVLEHFSFFHILGRIILFFRGVGSTIKQLSILLRWLGFLGPWMTPRWHQGWAAKRMALCMTKSRLAMKPSILWGLADTTLSRTGSGGSWRDFSRIFCQSLHRFTYGDRQEPQDFHRKTPRFPARLPV